MQSFDRCVEQLELSFTAVGNAKWYNHLEKALAIFYKVKYVYHMTQKFHPLSLHEINEYQYQQISCTSMLLLLLLRIAENEYSPHDHKEVTG